MKKKRKISGRKLLSYLLTLVMILGLMPGMSLTANASAGDEEKTDIETPLTLEAKTAGTILVSNPKSGMQYTLNDGSKQPVTTDAISVSVGDKVAFYGNGTEIASYGSNPSTKITGGTAECYIYGNVMSLVDETGFATATELKEQNTFKSLFSLNDKLFTHSTRKLVLPAMTLVKGCYQNMFAYCVNLTPAPELPATTLAENCYLTMFSDCNKLTAAPELPAPTLAKNCYSNMFQHCKNLTTAPELPATTLAEGCYSSMFSSCESLTAAPELPATTLAKGCYDMMFYRCKSLTTAPELPAMTLAVNCYLMMFNHCEKLNTVTCLATDISASNATNGWLTGVASSGTFTKAPTMTGWTLNSASGIPTGWTVQDAASTDTIEVTWDSTVMQTEVEARKPISTYMGITVTGENAIFNNSSEIQIACRDFRGSFTTELGNFTKIEVTGGDGEPFSGTGWSNGTWTGNASEVPFDGFLTDDNGNNPFTVTFTIEPSSALYSVTITAGDNMTWTTTSGAASQTGVTGAITDVVYTANDGYYFPEDYSVATVNGISVTRNSYTQITVSGTPTADTEITLPAPTQKTTPSAPTTAAATDCTTADNNDGKLTGVTTAMEYKKSDATEWTAGTGSDITGLVPGTYYVRVKATDTTNASANQELTINGFISATVTFKVVNGKWDDETTADKTVTLNGHDGDTLTLSAEDIPAVGTKPDENYKAGSWDVTPSTETAITGATTYTYTYAQKESISATVTFKVANGKWNDETTADKTVTLTGYEGDTLKLTEEQIPAVGSKPDDTYKAGSWDVTPSTETAITENTTYTYTYAQKETAVVTIAPTAKTLTNTGSAQELVTAGKAEGGTMQYALGTATEATEQYTTSIPTATDAGTYYVWYKVVGDDVHLDTDPVCIKVKILNTGMFADIEYGTWKYTAAEAVYDKKIMVGKGMVDGKIIFAPDDKVNRSQLVTSIYAMDGKPAVDYVQQFSDVNENDWFAKAVTWAANNGITAGTGAGQFGVTGNATREQVAVMLYKYAKYCGYDVSISESTTLDGFADADKVHDWALDAVKWAVERKIISGKGSGSNLKIAPEQGATRIECAAMLNKFSEVCTVVVIPDEILEEPLALPMEDIEETPASEDEIEDVIVDEDEEIIDEEDSEVVDEESDVIDEEDSEVADEESEVIDEEESEVTEEDSEAIDEEEAEVIDNQETEE